jgi:hypothetical protein
MDIRTGFFYLFSAVLLFAAFRSEYTVKLEFVITEYKDKQYRCVTGFTVSKS